MTVAQPTIELTIFQKSGGALTKRISLGDDGAVVSDGSACLMTYGVARRFSFSFAQEFGERMARFEPNEALATGSLRPDLPDTVNVVTKRRLNGGAHPGVIARSQDYIRFRPGVPALTLIDYDKKGMPAAVASKLEELGGLWDALVRIVPELKGTTRIERASTSAGLYDARNGERFGGNGGFHIYVLIKDGTDSERFLKTLHERCWLRGLGWMMVGAAGQLLERSIVDRVCGTPERLAFEGAPELVAPVAQDLAARRPVCIEGEPLDTIAACPPLSIVQLEKLRELRARERHRLAGESAKARELFIDRQARRLVERTGMDLPRARRTIERQCEGVLLPDLELPFDDPELAGKTVADVLTDPVSFEGETLSDPLEGPEYGRGKARIMRRADGSVWINSFAHGRTTYGLKLDFAAARAILDRTEKAGVVDVFVSLAITADLREDEIEQLRHLTAERGGVGPRALTDILKQARKHHAAGLARQERERRMAERTDPRPQIPAPAATASWLPQMNVLNDVLGHAPGLEPPMRDVDGIPVVVRVRRMPKLHAFTALGANQEESEETRLPSPEQPLLTRLTEPQLAELIEGHIDYVDAFGNPVHLHNAFVHHYHTRPNDVALPLASAVLTLPLVLGDGTLLKKPGLDRERGIILRIPSELSAILPDLADCTKEAVGKAMRFLTDEWLCDVATDYAGKCTIIAGALSVIERSLLPDRPIFWVTAGRRGGGKTTTLIMLLVAVTGIRPAAAAWSPNEEERRKALLAYLLEGMPALIWDNIPNGEKIACPHIERSCTTAWYSDRRLGVSETVATSAATIHFFTGNNVGPHRDLTSRSLQTRLVVDRHDPENRPFAHTDPIGWTEAHRGRILKELYIVLLGNPLFRGEGTAPQTRFKTWWSLIGQAVEFAARAHKNPTPEEPDPVCFRKLFLNQEKDDDASGDLAEALAAMDVLAANLPDRKFRAADVAAAANITGDGAASTIRGRAATLRELLFPKVSENQAVTAKATGKRLRRHLDEPVAYNGETLILKCSPDTHDKSLTYHVQRLPSQDDRENKKA
jgi:hypothetical protein